MRKTRKTLTALALAAALAAAASGVARAQDQELTSWRVPGWSVTPGLAIGATFDSNVALAAPPADTGRTQSDRLFVAQPFGHLEFLSPRTDFATGYRGYARRYVEIRELDGYDQQAYLSLRHLLSRRLTFTAANTFSAAPTTDDVELNGVPFSRTGTMTNSASASIDYRATRYIDVAARYDLTWVDFDPSAGAGPALPSSPDAVPGTFLTGGWVNAMRADARRRFGERFAAGVEYALRFADLNEGTRELTFQDAGATLRYLIGPRTTLTAAAGVSYLHDQLFDDRRTGPYYRASLTHDVDRATIGVSFQRQFVPSFGFGGSSDSQELRGFVRMPIARNRFYVQASGAWHRSDPFVIEELALDTVRVQTTLGYAAARWLRLEAFHAYTRQDSQVTGGEIDRHRAGGQIVISQPMRIR